MPRGGRGVVSQDALQLDYISIMHCSLPIISLLKRKNWGLAPAYIVKLQDIHVVIPTPPPNKQEHFVHQLWLCAVNNRDSNCLLVIIKNKQQGLKY